MNILGSDGTFRLASEEGVEGAVRRDYETSDGKSGTKWERVYRSIGGKIVDMEIYEGDYGTNIIIGVEHEEGIDHLSFNTGTPYGEDLMKKLPNIDFTKEVTFSPYNFTDDAGKNRRGISIVQDDEKIQNFFYDAKKKEPINGLEAIKLPKGKTISKDKWKAYFLEVRVFLLEYVQEHILPQFVKEELPEKEGF